MPKKKNQNRRRSPRPRPSWMGPLPAVSGCACHICRPDDRYDAEDRRTIDTVVQHGWQVLYVSDDAACTHPDHVGVPDPRHPDPEPGFAYTIGLGHRADHPELLMSGLGPRLMHSVLNDLAGQVLGGRRFVAGEVVEGVLAGFPVVLEQVAEAALDEVVPWSGWFHRRRPVALQVVWPSSASGLFPWQPGAPAILHRAQPPAWRIPSERGGAVAPDPGWDLELPPEALVMSCAHVVVDRDPVLVVARHDDWGQDVWQALCGRDHALEELQLVHASHLVRSSPSLRALGVVRPGQRAERGSLAGPWRIGPLSA